MVKRSKRTGRQYHSRREVSVRRPLHLTIKMVDEDGMPSLRQEVVRARFRELVRSARERGLTVIAYNLMSNHIHA